MELIIIALAALSASLLTLISGFGLGTLLLPVFALFFDLELAIALTAVVHVLNNLFKFGLLWKWVDRTTVLWFGIPGILGALGGVWVLHFLGSQGSFISWNGFEIEPLPLIIGLIMIFFAFTELFPGILQLRFKRTLLVPGGLISGFFGGLSGHQGALRSLFLIKANLSKEAYIASGVAIALLVDFTRIPLYVSRMPSGMMSTHSTPLIIATLSAFTGAFLGKRLMKKITIRTVQIVVGVLMILLGLGLIFGRI